jgi:D-glycero-beta-D-manno-heptose-7-phosphate kinase
MFSSIVNDEFRKKRIVVIGDLVADQFLHGTISRVSREAPVFILRHDITETVAGGAANAAANVAALGGNAVLVGIVGNDENGRKLLEKLAERNVDCGYIVHSEGWRTTTKVRVLAAQESATRQQVIRIDYENPELPKREILLALKEAVRNAIADADAIILSDYNYGVVSTEVAQIVGDLAKKRGIHLLIDSRQKLESFAFATSATPNQDEVEQILGRDFTSNAAMDLCTKLGFHSLLITRGNKGMLLIEQGKTPLQIDAIGLKEPVDVTGAGDSVIATYALGLASGLSFGEAAMLANHAGGIAVMKKGTAAVEKEELLDSIKSIKK